MCVSGSDLAGQQRAELDRLLRTDPAGLAEVDAVCRSFGITKPTKDERRAALQVMWRPQVTSLPHIYSRTSLHLHFC